MRDDASSGVGECWIVSPEAQGVTVLTRDNGVFRKVDVFIMGERLVSATRPGLELDINKLFALRKKRQIQQETET
ncbi:MAG: hypothetical protein ACLQVD_11765 [Capsulimonadaceae bacterium]